MKSAKYQVNDEDGPLRVFDSRKEAEKFASGAGCYVVVLDVPAKKPAVDWSNYEESPF